MGAPIRYGLDTKISPVYVHNSVVAYSSDRLSPHIIFHDVDKSLMSTYILEENKDNFENFRLIKLIGDETRGLLIVGSIHSFYILQVNSYVNVIRKIKKDIAGCLSFSYEDCRGVLSYINVCRKEGVGQYCLSLWNIAEEEDEQVISLHIPHEMAEYHEVNLQFLLRQRLYLVILFENQPFFASSKLDVKSISFHRANISYIAKTERINAFCFLRHSKDEPTLCMATDLGNIFIVDAELEVSRCIDVDKDGIVSLTACYSGGFFAGTSGGNVFHYVGKHGSNKYVLNRNYFLNSGGDYPICGLAISSVNKSILIMMSGLNQLFKSSVKILDFQIEDANGGHFIASTPLFFAADCIAQSHQGKILNIDVCESKAYVISVGEDETLRLWNYWSNKPVGYKSFLRKLDGPLSLHPSGHFVIVGFNDAIQIMCVHATDIISLHDIQFKHCTAVLFSHGGHLFAAARGHTIYIYNFHAREQIAILNGHNGSIRQLSWTPSDLYLVSIGDEGITYLWNICNGTRVGENSCTRHPIGVTSGHDENESWILENGGRCLVRIKLPDLILNEIKFEEGISMNSIVRSKDFVIAGHSRGPKVGSVRFFLEDNVIDEPCCESSVELLAIAKNDCFLFAGSLGCAICKIDFSKFKRHNNVVGYSKDSNILVCKSEIQDLEITRDGLQNKIRELEIQTEYQERLKAKTRDDKIREAKESFNDVLEREETKIKILAEEMRNLKQKYGEVLFSKEKELHETRRSFELESKNKLAKAIEDYLKTEESIKIKRDLQEQKETEQISSHEDQLSNLEHELKSSLDIVTREMEHTENENRRLNAEIKEQSRQVQEDISDEIDCMTTRFEKLIKDEKDVVLKSTSAIGITKMKISAAMREIEERKEEIKNMLEVEENMTEENRSLQMNVEELKARSSSIDTLLKERGASLEILRKKNEELTAFKFVLDFKVLELSKLIDPRETERKDLEQQLLSKQEEKQKMNLHYIELRKNIDNMNEEVQRMKEKIERYRGRVRNQESTIRKLLLGIRESSQLIQRPEELKPKIDLLNNIWIKSDFFAEGSKKEEANIRPRAMFNLQKEYRRLLNDLKDSNLENEKNAGRNRNERTSLVEENLGLLKEIEKLRSVVT